MFVDRVKVSISAGKGGDGIVSFRHEIYRPKGGPDGGDGGSGGDVVLTASRNQNTLAAFRYKKLLKAQDGQNGAKAKKRGKGGGDLMIDVPVGTLITDEKAKKLADLTKDGQQVVIARGGKGGFGNAHFVSSTRQAPRVSEKGEKGQVFEAVFELKMIADVGIVGLPNAGKSTLLSIISNARPAIDSYPFTTLVPNLGVVDIDGKTSLLFADIPGLIEGASEGKGLGDEFLRHVERTKILVHLIDIYGEDIAQDYKTIMSELKAYKPDLSQRAQVVVLTKVEGVDSKQLKAAIKKISKLVPKGTPVMAISSSSGQGVKELLRAVNKRVEQVRKAKTKAKTRRGLPVIGLKPRDEDWIISKEGDKYIVAGKKIERFASRTDFNNEAGIERLRDIMLKMGIIRELERRGTKPDQKIQIGKPSLGEIKY